MYNRINQIVPLRIIMVIALLKFVSARIIGNNLSDDFEIHPSNLTLYLEGSKINKTILFAKNVVIHISGLSLFNEVEDKNDRQLIDYPRLQRSINESVDPCDDFYDFVCGEWIEEQILKPHEAEKTQASMAAENINRQMKAIFANRKRYSKNRIFDLMFVLYEKCIDLKERGILKSEPLFNIFRKIRNANLKYVTDWLILVRPINLFYSIDVRPDFVNVSQNLLYLSATGSLLDEQYYLNSDLRQTLIAFRKYLLDLLTILQMDDKEGEFLKNGTKELERRINSLLNIDQQLAEIVNSSMKDNDDFTSHYELISLKDLQFIAPSLNWKRYIAGILPKNVLEIIDLEKLKITVINVDLIKEIEKLIRSLDNQSLSDYIEWKIILASVSFLDQRYLNAKKEFEKALLGVNDLEPIKNICQDEAVQLFPNIANYIYVTEYFSNNTEEEVNQMIENIRDAFLEILEEADWMDDKTRVLAKNKVKAIEKFVAYDSRLLNLTWIEKKYEELSYNSSWRYSSIIETLTKYLFDRSFSKLIKKNNRKIFNFPAPTANAFYHAVQNQIAIMPGILQEPYYDKTLPLSVNYGGIGAVIGHEITHGFDDEGRQFDSEGNLHDWWFNETKENFMNLKECFIDQYTDVEVPGTGGFHINGLNTQAENIADNGGIRAAYRAFKKELKERKGDVKKIKNMEQYTPEQMFFMNFAYSWCAVSRPEAIVESLISDNHSPPRHRVNIVLSNLEEFSEVFLCPLGSPMNSERKCRVW